VDFRWYHYHMVFIQVLGSKIHKIMGNELKCSLRNYLGTMEFKREC